MLPTDACEILRQTDGEYHVDTPELRIGLLPVNDAELAWIHANAGGHYGVIARQLHPHELEAAYVAQANQRAEAEGLSQRQTSADRDAARRFARRINGVGLTAVKFVAIPANGHDARSNGYSFQITLAREFPKHVSRYVELCLHAGRQAMIYNDTQEQ